MSKLITYVHVTERDEQGNPAGRSGTFGPGDVVPAWARKIITNPDVWDQEPTRDSAEDDEGEPPLAAPPRSGAGSGVDAWAAYAAQLGVQIPAEAKREEIIAELEDAGHLQKPEA